MVDEDDRPTESMDAAKVHPDEEHTARDARLGPGTDIGGYLLDGEIGKGGMGFVYGATHPVIGKRAAIKVLKPEVSKSPIVVERFIQEARAVNQIGHPNIIDIFAFGKLPDGRAYHIMDLLIGESLRKRLRRGPLHPSEAASVIDEMASALMAAHDKGFVHRDLKPDNVFLVEHPGRWPEVKLLDFGLAKLMPEAGVAAFQTKTGVMLGTPEYMSPEQARGIGVDYRTDIYALGVLTFEILAGVRPFPSMGDAFATLQAHAEEQPPSIADLVPGLPIEMVQLVDTMLAKEPAARPSLAAVRTVIKRLRTTQLPTRTAAGLEMSLPSIPIQGQQGPQPSLGAVRPSRLGAEPVLPGDPVPVEPARRPSQPRVSTPMGSPPPPSNPSNPPLSSPQSARNPSQPAFQVPPHSSGQQPARSSTNPPSSSTHGSGSGGTSSPGIRVPPHPSHPPGSHALMQQQNTSAPMPRFNPVVTPGQSASGLAMAGAPKIGTVLGVGAPLPQRSVASVSQPLDVSKPRSSRLWLLLGALLAIAAGIVLALVLVDL